MRSQILKVLCETAVTVRTKAMKCLTAVVEADPSILARVSIISLRFAGKFYCVGRQSILYAFLDRF